jgi:DNA-binding MarR family transcriptional regulator
MVANQTKERAMPQAPMDGDRPRECFVGAARKASRRLTQFYDDALAPCGLKSTQYSIFSELTRFASSPTLAELASALVSDRSAVGHNLRPLIRDGYLALEAGPEDRRERRIVLTARGQSKYLEARALWQAAQDEFLVVHGRERCESLRAALLDVAYDPRLGRTDPRIAP